MTAPRITSIDGLRGLLALYVLATHYAEFNGGDLPYPGIAVGLFFVMSGYVLTPGWRGDYPGFLLRRFLRLWPVYAFALASGSLIFWRALDWTDYAFYPFFPSKAAFQIDGPVWSLHIEMWAMLAFPLIVWGGKTLPRTIAVAVLFFAANHFVERAGNGALFVLGSYLSRYSFDVAIFNGRIAQWLGRVSYSLYLTHVVVMGALAPLPFAWALQIPASLLVGYLVWRTIETRSITLSHMAGQFVRQTKWGFA